MVAIERHGLSDSLIDERTRQAEKRLVRNIVIGTIIAVPVLAGVYVLMMALAVGWSSVDLGTIAMGAGVGTLAALFWGMWAGVAASVSEFEEIERAGLRRHSERR